MTPVQLEILLHCHTRANPPPRLDSNVTKDTIELFLETGIIETTSENSVYKTTEKGAAWVSLILSIPEPKQVYVDQNGAIIKGT